LAQVAELPLAMSVGVLTAGGANTAAVELAKRLPRLLFAAIDRFPLACGGGCDDSPKPLPVLAVRAVPVEDRLDAGTGAELRALAGGQRHFQRNAARRINLKLKLPLLASRASDEIADETDDVDVVVCWHDVTDFMALVLKGNPSCVEAVASEERPLFASHEWDALRSAFGQRHCEALFAGKAYRMGCAAPAAGLLRRRNAGAGDGFLTGSELEVVRGLCHRAARAASKDLALRVADFAVRGETRMSEWQALTADVFKSAAGALPSAETSQTTQLIEAWAKDVRGSDFQAFAADCAVSASPSPDALAGPPALSEEWARCLATVWPKGAELVFLAQTGSFMYDLQVASSDEDYGILFLARPEDLVGRTPPQELFQCHGESGFASDKHGVVEYKGRELGSFLVELAKGNPANIELLFTEKPHLASSVWRELRSMRRGFLSLRCAKQYLGFVADRIRKGTAACEEKEPKEAGSFDEVAAKQVSKCLYHAHHKLFELARILRGGEPCVALCGEERSFAMGLRLRPPTHRDQALALLAEVAARRAALVAELKHVETVGIMPAEADTAALALWLRGLRRRQLRSCSTCDE